MNKQEAKNLIEAWQKSFNSVVGVDDQVVWQQYIPSGGQ